MKPIYPDFASCSREFEVAMKEAQDTQDKLLAAQHAHSQALVAVAYAEANLDAAKRALKVA
jgi:hypothetical protein